MPELQDDVSSGERPLQDQFDDLSAEHPLAVVIVLMIGGLLLILANAGLWVLFADVIPVLGGSAVIAVEVVALVLVWRRLGLSGRVTARPSARGDGAQWLWPFAIVIGAPLFTMAIQTALLGSLIIDGDACSSDPRSELLWSCPARHTIPTLAPGLVHAVVLLGLLSQDTRTRRAALVAGGLGLVRVLAPALVYAREGDIEVRGYAFYQMGTTDAAGELSSGLWLATVAALVFLVWRWRDKTPREPRWNERGAADR